MALTPLPVSSTGVNLIVSDGLETPTGVDPNKPPTGNTRSAFDVNFRDGFARNWNINLQRAFGANYMVEAAYAGSHSGSMVVKVDINQAPAVVGVSDANVNRPYIGLTPGIRQISQSQSIGTIDYHALLLKFQRRFANNFSFLNSYTFGKSIDIASDNEAGLTNNYDVVGYHHARSEYDVRHTFSSSVIYEVPWARERIYGGWQVNGILYLRSGLPFTVVQTQGVRSTGTGNRPDRICDGKLDNPTVEKWFDTACFVAPTDTTGTYGNAGRNILEGPGQFNIDASIIKNTRIGRINTEIRIEAFNLLNHPQFANPVNNTGNQLGNASFGQLTQMLSNPSCSLCGTIERQVQIGLKMRF